MSELDGTCEYVLNPDDPKTWGGEEGDECYVDEDVLNEDGVWTCPHEAEKEDELCIFHLPIEEKEDEAVVDAFLKSVETAAADDEREHARFLASQFESFELDDNTDLGRVNSLNLSYSTVHSRFDWSGVTANMAAVSFCGVRFRSECNLFSADFRSAVKFLSSEFHAAADLSDIHFGGKVQFRGVEFRSPVDIEGAMFDRVAIFSEATFSDDVNFRDSEFSERTDFFDVNFNSEAEFSKSRFCDQAEFNQSRFESEALLDRSRFEAKCSFKHTEFAAYASFYEAEFQGEPDFMWAEFEDNSDFRAIFEEGASFSLVNFGGGVDFGDAEFNDDVNFSSSQFDGRADFEHAEFVAANFEQVEFGGRVKGGYATFSDDVSLYQAVFRREATFELSEFEGELKCFETEFITDASFRRAKFRGTVKFHHAEFGGDANFHNTVFSGKVTFSQAECKEGIDLRESKITGANFEGAMLNNSTFANAEAENVKLRESHVESSDLSGADLTGANLERATLSNTDLFGSDLSGCKLFGARIGDAAIDTETTFDKQGDDRCVYDPRSTYDYDHDEEQKIGRFQKAMGTYHVLEQLTRANTLPDEQAKFFARRQDMRRAQLREDGRQLEYWFAEAQNAIFRHGESFSRVVGWSVGTIVVFAFIFPFGGWLQSDSTGTLTYEAIAESPELMWQAFYHSLLLFLTGGGPLSPTGFAGEVLTAIESLIAPILLALLIFVLGRRAAR
jgi:uncharacterized protein YjbI with pentapeptide repeats